MGVVCKILIKKLKGGNYRPKDEVSGTVHYAIDEATEYKNIVISFVGKGTCHWTEKSNHTTTSYSNEEQYVSDHINVLEKKSDTAIVPIGTYEHPFRFIIPENAPSSHKDYHSNICYKIKLKFEKPNFFSLTSRFSTEITVRSFVNPTMPPGPTIYGIKKTLSKLFSSKDHVLDLKAEILNSFLGEGENIEIKYEVANAADVEATVKTELIKKVIYTSSGGRTKIVENKEKGCFDKSPKVLQSDVTQFSAAIQTLPDMYSLQNSQVVALEYEVVVTLRLPVPHINARVIMPVVIGEKDSNETEMDRDDDAPPSYWEVMAEDERAEKSEKS